MILQPTTRKHSFITQIPSNRHAPVFLPIFKNRLFLSEKQMIVGTFIYPIYHNCHYPKVDLSSLNPYIII